MTTTRQSLSATASTDPFASYNQLPSHIPLRPVPFSRHNAFTDNTLIHGAFCTHSGIQCPQVTNRMCSYGLGGVALPPKPLPPAQGYGIGQRLMANTKRRKIDDDCLSTSDRLRSTTTYLLDTTTREAVVENGDDGGGATSATSFTDSAIGAASWSLFSSNETSGDLASSVTDCFPDYMQFHVEEGNLGQTDNLLVLDRTSSAPPGTTLDLNLQESELNALQRSENTGVGLGTIAGSVPVEAHVPVEGAPQSGYSDLFNRGDAAGNIVGALKVETSDHFGLGGARSLTRGTESCVEHGCSPSILLPSNGAAVDNQERSSSDASTTASISDFSASIVQVAPSNIYLDTDRDASYLSGLNLSDARFRICGSKSLATAKYMRKHATDGIPEGGENFAHRPDLNDQTLAELNDISCFRNDEKYRKLIVDYQEGISFPLGEGGRELLRACLNVKGCKGRQLQGASVPALLALAKAWGLWDVAIRIKVERSSGQLCPQHDAFVRFKATQSQMRKYVKKEYMLTERDNDGCLSHIVYDERRKITLGKEGRETLRAQLRRLHDKHAGKMDDLLENHGFKYSELRNATVQQLSRMAYVCNLWDKVVDACRKQEEKRDGRNKDYGRVATQGHGLIKTGFADQPSPKSEHTFTASPMRSNLAEDSLEGLPASKQVWESATLQAIYSHDQAQPYEDSNPHSITSLYPMSTQQMYGTPITNADPNSTIRVKQEVPDMYYQASCDASSRQELKDFLANGTETEIVEKLAAIHNSDTAFGVLMEAYDTKGLQSRPTPSSDSMTA